MNQRHVWVVVSEERCRWPMVACESEAVAMEIIRHLERLGMDEALVPIRLDVLDSPHGIERKHLYCVELGLDGAERDRWERHPIVCGPTDLAYWEDDLRFAKEQAENGGENWVLGVSELSYDDALGEARERLAKRRAAMGDS